MKNRSKRTSLERRPYVDRLREQWKLDIIEFADLGDPDVFGTDAYNFMDKPHRFIRELKQERGGEGNDCH